MKYEDMTADERIAVYMALGETEGSARILAAMKVGRLPRQCCIVEVSEKEWARMEARKARRRQARYSCIEYGPPLPAPIDVGSTRVGAVGEPEPSL